MRRYRIILPLVLVSVAAIGVAIGQAKVLPKHNPPALATENWTGSDLPYKDVEQKIKREYSGGESLDAIALKYKAKALLRPSDPVAQFAWIYAARGADVVNGSLPRQAPILLQDLEQADPGNIYEYTKYRFCMSEEANVQLPRQEVKTIGDRLLNYDSKDNWSRLSLIYLLTNNYKTGAVEALPYALAWINREPKNEKAHSALGLIYFNMWEGSNRKNQALARKALTEYQAYMRLAPPNDGFRKLAAVYIKHLQQAVSG